MAFLASVAFYGLSTSVFGAHIGRIGPFASVRRTLILLPGAWCCAAAGSSTGMLWLLLAGYGPLLGIGIAHGYLATTGAMQRWWPEKKGVAAGVAVAGFEWLTVGVVVCAGVPVSEGLGPSHARTTRPGWSDPPKPGM